MNISIDLNVNSWISELNLSGTELENYINQVLAIGYKVLKSSQLLVNDNQLLEPITDNLNGLKSEIFESHENLNIQCNDLRSECKALNTSLLKLTGNISTSSLKGKIGEDFIESILRNHFPDDTVVTTAQTSHASDIHLQSSGFPTILIESKLYTNLVQTPEIDKFYSDLETTGIDYGVFISLSSGIAKHKRFSYDFYKGKHLIYLPNAGFDGNNIVYAVLFLKEISKISNEQILTKNIFDEKCQAINDILEGFDSTYKHLNNLKNNTLEIKLSIDKHLQSLVTEMIQVELIIKQSIIDTKKQIIDILQVTNQEADEKTTEFFEEFILDLFSKKSTEKLATHLQLLKDREFLLKEVVPAKHYIFTYQKITLDLKIQKTKSIFEFVNQNIKIDIKSSSDILDFKKLLDLYL